MTLSNFDWTDKESVKWFVLLPTGHEGPYSLSTLESKKISRDIKIWSEGLDAPLKLSEVLKKTSMPVQDVDEEIPPPLPPLPDADEVETVAHVSDTPPVKKKIEISRMKIWIGGSLALVFFFYLLVGQFLKGRQKFEFARLPKMSQALHERILNESRFDGFDKKIFFKEYMPADRSQIWFVTSSFHTCEVEASFSSLKGKLLSLKDEKVTFKSKGTLKEHVVEFTRFDFSEGTKIIPGMYEVDIRASDCGWNGLVTSMANGFTSPEEEYLTRTKMVLYPNGAVEFNELLEKLIQKKLDAEKKIQGEEELFWEDLQQKYQTLLAITLQIETLFLDMLDKNLKGLKVSVDAYTKKFGHFLTQFVVANEEYFKTLEKTGATNLSRKRSYESGIRMTSKEIGLESMKNIEHFQKLKAPSEPMMKAEKVKVKKVYEKLKERINQKIIQITEDRANS